VYQKENGIARGCEGIEKSTIMELMSLLGISSIHDRIVKNEDVFLKKYNSVLTGYPSNAI
jgi:hypothetical protein